MRPRQVNVIKICHTVYHTVFVKVNGYLLGNGSRKSTNIKKPLLNKIFIRCLLRMCESCVYKIYWLVTLNISLKYIAVRLMYNIIMNNSINLYRSSTLKYMILFILTNNYYRSFRVTTMNDVYFKSSNYDWNHKCKLLMCFCQLKIR